MAASAVSRPGRCWAEIEFGPLPREEANGWLLERGCGDLGVSRETPLAELFALDARYAGQGPVLVNEREEYAKYLLRGVSPWMSWDSYQPDRGFVSGSAPPAPRSL